MGDPKAKITPMMKQWMELKAQAQDALLFFRLGDFYEMFEEDALKAAPVLGLTLTSRNKKGDDTPLCGVPASTLETYLTKALDHGFKVALVEQTELPSAEKKIVKREIVQWFTPGIRLLHTDERAHYAAVISGKANDWTIAAADAGTGHVVLDSAKSLEALEDLMDRLPIEDLRTPPQFFPEDYKTRIKMHEACFLLSKPEAEKKILQAFGLASLEDSPCRSKLETQSLGSLFDILQKAHPKDKLRFLSPHIQASHVFLTAATRKNLYLFQPEGKSIFDLLNHTKTSLGRRELKQILSSPTQKLKTIQSRQDLVAYFRNDSSTRKLFRSKLTSIQDIHRLLRRLRTPHQLFSMTKSLLSGLSAARTLLPKHSEIFLFHKRSEAIKHLVEKLDLSLQMSADSELGWIRSGINKNLDELRDLKQNANKLLSELEEKLRAQTKVPGLKIKFHQIFGYVAEVTALHKEKIPETAKRIQTLANSERFKTEELSQLEEKILSLDSRLKEAEKAELKRLYGIVDENQTTLLEWTKSLATLDCFQSLAEVSATHAWSTPETVSEINSVLKIQAGTHPLAEGSFVPLHFELDAKNSQLILLTGPNMAGKSTVLRLAALVALLHQIGSDVPAERAQLSIFDRIVCRMGAMDDISSGQSTFFVEMREVSSMLFGATEKSLLLFDEIGRGTSTFDGMSLAWAITESVHEMKCLSLIATHYLELAELKKTLPRIRNFHLGVEEVEGKLIFTRTLQAGAASRSYGIQVARLAELSPAILSRAEKKLQELEAKREKSVPILELIS